MKKHVARGWWPVVLFIGMGGWCHFSVADTGVLTATAIPAASVPWYTILTPSILMLTLVLGCCSAFFSASEVAFLSLHKVQLRTMRGSGNSIHRLIAYIMKRPGSLLTTILMGNTIVNVLLSIAFAGPVAAVFHLSLRLPTTHSYILSVIITTSTLLFFCEILPKVFATMRPQAFTFFAVIPLYLVDRLITPFRYVAMLLVGFIFKTTGLSQVQPAPFLTDDEFISLLSESEASGIIEKEERDMIAGILEFDDVTLREILVPRPDIVGVKEADTVAEALEMVREHEYARMPVYRDDLDHIVGILYAKDLLPVIEAGALDRPVSAFMRPPHFVPETMSVSEFVKMAQHVHIHIAIVVDEYGGTEGLVTLQDALREVVGDIGEEDDTEDPVFHEVSDGVWQFAGNYPLNEFEEYAGVASGDEEHTTLGGFLMALSDKILEPGDNLEYCGLHFLIERVDKKRVTRVLVKDRRHESVEKEDES